ncbi:hypothetical protein HC251_24185 [Iamia sp. SCSIO 61187]|uniref:PGN_0703 family putative restriction endonuclease n=1 Tax=Iamia sp. SCSIO 61187 TaxID=2722752 RepID=UPI001C63B0CC|nr:hypothetical protein [Iamia sp. SCSIO 61187]QYG95222.1 hypothetical protein HC251_24185 [Iamia sp. SCSIO 61187]
MGGPSRAELEAAQVWEGVDRVPGAEMTAFRRTLRLRQAHWREAQGLPIGSQSVPAARGGGERPIGSRIDHDHAVATGANFLTPAAHDAVRHRIAHKEPWQTLNTRRLWGDLLSSMPLCFNLFGPAWADLALADDLVHDLWPDTPGRVAEVRFEHSPGRGDPAYLGNRSAFDVAFLLDLGGGRRGIVGVETKYHEWAKPEVPRPDNAERYREVTERSGAFVDDIPARIGEDDRALVQVWLDHLLLLSMLQHPSAGWDWGRFVILHPAGNVSFDDAIARYRALLVDDATFDRRTLEQVVASPDLRRSVADPFAARYLDG